MPPRVPLLALVAALIADEANTRTLMKPVPAGTVLSPLQQAIVKLYRQVANANRFNPLPRWALVLLALRRGDAGEAEAQLNSLVQLLPEEEGKIVAFLADSLDSPDPLYILLGRCREIRSDAPEGLREKIDGMIRELLGDSE